MRFHVVFSSVCGPVWPRASSAPVYRHCALVSCLILQKLQKKLVPMRCSLNDFTKAFDVVDHAVLVANNNNNNTLIYIAPACRMTSEALADSSSRATECLTEK